jgi:hypothetical protein
MWLVSSDFLKLQQELFIDFMTSKIIYELVIVYFLSGFVDKFFDVDSYSFLTSGFCGLSIFFFGLLVLSYLYVLLTIRWFHFILLDFPVLIYDWLLGRPTTQQKLLKITALL